jgi:hypothetical protein
MGVKLPTRHYPPKAGEKITGELQPQEVFCIFGYQKYLKKFRFPGIASEYLA